MAINGSRSQFTLTQRDVLASPSQTLDANLINTAADVIVRAEQWARNAITVVHQESEAPALLFTVQRWLWSYTGTGSQAPCLLDVSPAFLEDSGVIPRQANKPSDPLVSLAQDVSFSVPAYVPLKENLAGSLNMQRTPQPAWVTEIKGAPLVTFSVRLFAATGTDVFHVENPVFFDAGNGISPRVQGNICHSVPGKRNTAIPQSTYEICVLVLNWSD